MQHACPVNRTLALIRARQKQYRQTATMEGRNGRGTKSRLPSLMRNASISRICKVETAEVCLILCQNGVTSWV